MADEALDAQEGGGEEGRIDDDASGEAESTGAVEWQDLSETTDVGTGRSDEATGRQGEGKGSGADLDIETDAFVRSVLNGLKAPTFVVDTTGEITHVNDQAVDMFGVTEKEALGSRPYDLIEEAKETPSTPDSASGTLDVEGGMEMSHADSDDGASGVDADVDATDLIAEAFETAEDIQQREQHLPVDGAVVPVSRTVTVLYDERGDPIGALQMNRDISQRVKEQERTHALETYQEQVMDDLQDKLVRLAEGDLTIDPEVPPPDAEFEAIETVYEEFTELNRYLDTATANLRSVLERLTGLADDLAEDSDRLSANSEEVTSSIEQINASSDEMADGAQRLAGRTDELDGNISELSASIEEITASAQQIDANAEQAGDLAAKGVEDGGAAVEQIRDANDAAGEITEEVRVLESKMDEVEAILEVISDIADETHLLALNANIEAARAGEDGAGFAVVAREVKQLAEESRQSADEIESIVTDVQEQTGTVADRIDETNREIDEGTAAVEDIVERLTEIEASVQQTSAGAAEVSQAVEDQAENVDGVSSIAEETAAMSEQLSASVQQISAGVADQSEAVEDVTVTAESLSGKSDDLYERIEQFRLTTDERATLDDVDEVDVDADLG